MHKDQYLNSIGHNEINDNFIQYLIKKFFSATFSFPDKLDSMALYTSVFEVFPRLDTERNPEEEKSKEQEDKKHSPDQNSIMIRFVSVSFCIAEDATGEMWHSGYIFYNDNIRICDQRRCDRVLDLNLYDLALLVHKLVFLELRLCF